MKLLKIEKFFFLNLAFRYLAVRDTYIFMLCVVSGFFSIFKAEVLEENNCPHFCLCQSATKLLDLVLKTYGS